MCITPCGSMEEEREGRDKGGHDILGSRGLNWPLEDLRPYTFSITVSLLLSGSWFFLMKNELEGCLTSDHSPNSDSLKFLFPDPSVSQRFCIFCLLEMESLGLKLIT